MARGGARVGAGRKPRQRSAPQPFEPVIIDGGKNAPTSADQSVPPPALPGAISAEPPDDLPEAQHAAWRTFAAQAIEARTLAPRTVGAFRLLCKLVAMEQAISEQIGADGWTHVKCTVDGSGQEHQELKAHPLLTAHSRIAQRVEQLLARFQLAPFGKPVGGSSKPKESAPNPWAAIVAGRRG